MSNNNSQDFTLRSRVVLDLDNLNQGMRQAQSTTRNAANNMTQSFQITNRAAGLLKNTVTGMIAAFSVDKIIEGLQFTTDASEELHISMMGLRATAKGWGQDQDEAIEAAKELTDGLMDVGTASKGLKNLMSTGFSLSEALDLSKAMKDIGAYNNVVGDLGQAYIDSTKGLKTNSMELIENIGLTERVSVALKKEGISIADGIDLTNNAAQRQAVYNSIMRQAAIYQGNAAELSEQYRGKQAELKNEFNKLAVTIGDKVKPMMLTATKVMTKGITSLRKGIEGTGETSEKLEPLVERLTELKSKTKLTVDEQSELKKIMNDISLLSPDIVSSYDDQGNAIINQTNALKGLTAAKIDDLTISKSKLEIENEKLEKDKIKFDKKYEIAKKARDNRNKKLKEQEKNLKKMEQTVNSDKVKNQEKLLKLNSERLEIQKKIDKLGKNQTLNSNDALYKEFIANKNEIANLKKKQKLYKNKENQLYGFEDKKGEYHKGLIEKNKENQAKNESYFQEENRTLIANKNLTDSKLSKNKILIEQYDKLAKSLNNVKTIEGYKTTTGIKDKDKRKAENKIKEAQNKADMELQNFLSSLKKKNNKSLELTENYESKKAEIEKRYQLSLVNAKTDTDKEILKKTKEKDLQLLNQQKEVNENIIKLEKQKQDKIKKLQSVTKLQNAKKKILELEKTTALKLVAIEKEKQKKLTDNSKQNKIIITKYDNKKNSIADSFIADTKKIKEELKKQNIEFKTSENLKQTILKNSNNIKIDTEKQYNKKINDLQNKNNEELKQIKNKAKSIEEDYTNKIKTIKQNYLENVKNTEINSANEINSLKEVLENKKFIFENSTKKKIEIENNYNDKLSSLRSEYKINLLKAKTDEEKEVLKKELVKNEKILAVEKEYAEKLIKVEIEKQKKLKQTSSTDEKQSITVEYNTIQNNTVNEMKNKKSQINYDYESDKAENEALKKNEQIYYNHLYKKHQIKADYEKELFDLNREYMLQSVNERDKDKRDELEKERQHKQALLELERDNNLQILELKKQRDKELANTDNAEQQFAINQIYDEAISEQKRILIQQSDNQEKIYNKQQKEAEKNKKNTFSIEKALIRGKQQLGKTKLKIEQTAMKNLISGKSIGVGELKNLAKIELKNYLINEGTKSGMQALTDTAWAASDFALGRKASAVKHIEAAGLHASFAAAAGIAAQAIHIDTNIDDYSSTYDDTKDTETNLKDSDDKNSSDSNNSSEDEKERTRVYLKADTKELLKTLIPDLNQMVADGEVDLVIN